MSNVAELNKIAKYICQSGKGILAADESTATIAKRFEKIKVENVEANRQAYRDLLFNTPGMEKYISGVILFDETIRQKGLDGTQFSSLLTSLGVYPGIKLDAGAKDHPLCPGEFVTEGLDGLPKRVAEYVAMGAKFAKWRAVITIGNGIPTDTSIRTNAHALARYAAICQAGGLVPIVEPEVLMDGSHTIDTCEAVTEKTLNVVFEELVAQKVALEGIILKPSMVISGTTCPQQASIQEVAARTVAVLKRTVPAAVPGIAFLSGGQSDEVATAHLNAMNKIGSLPWPLTYSYGRALQAAAQDAWRGKAENVKAGQDAFYKRAFLNSLASKGQYDSTLEALPSSNLGHKFKLAYFPIRGRADPIRLLFVDNNVDFEDQAVAGADWAALKPTLHFGQMPVLFDNGVQIPQMNSILRHLGRLFGLYGSSLGDAVHLDFVNDGVEDARMAYVKVIYQAWDTKDTFVAGLPALLAPIEKLLVADYIVGNKPQYADYSLYSFLDCLVVLSSTSLDASPRLKAFHQRVASRPNIAAYLASGKRPAQVNGNGNQ